MHKYRERCRPCHELLQTVPGQGQLVWTVTIPVQIASSAGSTWLPQMYLGSCHSPPCTVFLWLMSLQNWAQINPGTFGSKKIVCQLINILRIKHILLTCIYFQSCVKKWTSRRFFIKETKGQGVPTVGQSGVSIVQWATKQVPWMHCLPF